MDSNKTKARIVGVLFLLAVVASLAGGIWLNSFLTQPNLFTSVAENKTQVVIAVLLEMVNGLAVIGIAVGLYSFFREKYESLALGYVALRIVEAVVIFAAVISPLVIVALGQEFTAGADLAGLAPVGESLLAVRTLLVGQITGIFFSLAALLLFYLLYQTRLVPRFISIWGLISVALIFTWNVIELIGISISFGMILAIPMILNEIFLAIWLIVKGIDQSEE